MPLLIDIFNSRFFRAVELTPTVEALEPVPAFFGGFGERLFVTRRSRTRMVAVRRSGNTMTLIPTSPIGAPPVELELSGADIRPFLTRRLAKASTVLAEMLNGVINAPEDVQLRSVAQEIAERSAQIRTDFELTHEHMRLGAILGKVVDADGVTVLDDWYANWSIPEPTPIDFALDNASTNIRAKCEALRDAVIDNAEGAFITGTTEIHAIAGKNFWSLLTLHPNVEKFWMGWSAAADLRGAQPDTFEFGGIIWHKYRGTSDGTTLTIDPDEARAFPVGARDAFARVFGPAEFEPFINEPGRDIYAITIPDRDRGAFTRVELYCYPLYICQRPKMLQIATV